MRDSVLAQLANRPLWHWLVFGLVISELLTLFVSLLVSHALWGSMPWQVLIIGIVDSLLVSFVIVSLLLLLLRAIRRLNTRLEERNHELTAALAEIKTLRGILPICSYCKQIRNDKGYYEQIETYLLKNSAVDFSHTICPDCAEKHFPGMSATQTENPSHPH